MSNVPNDAALTDDLISAVLGKVKTIAVVGASINPARPSNGVTRFLVSKGYRVFPVNPGQAGKTLHGQTIYATLADVPEPIDMVDVFRAPEHLAKVVAETLALSPRPRVLWTQLGVVDEAAAAGAQEAGLDVIMNRCPAIEYPRLVERIEALRG